MVTEMNDGTDAAPAKSAATKTERMSPRKQAKKASKAKSSANAAKPAKRSAKKSAKALPRAAAKKLTGDATNQRQPGASRKVQRRARASGAAPGPGFGRRAEALMKRMATLQAKLDAITQRERVSVLEQIRHAVERFSFTAAELFRNKPAARALSTAGRNRGAGERAVVAKYRDDQGNVWVGRGKRPLWLKERLDAGAKLEDFAV
jgi:DNA-binding protein H-NS